MPVADWDPNKVSHFYLQEQTPIQTLGLLLSTSMSFYLRLQRLGSAKVTPDSALLFNKKGAQCQEQAREGEGSGQVGEGRARGRGEARARAARSRAFSCCPFGLSQWPFPCISEMLRKEHFPEEPCAR